MLNLDALVAPRMSVTIAGVEHAVKDMGVGDFLAANADSKLLTNKDDVASNLEATIRQVRRLVPTLPEEQILTFNFDQLFTLVQFLNGTLEDAAAPGEAISEKESSGN